LLYLDKYKIVLFGEENRLKILFACFSSVD